jgi:hypothetical protein
VTPASRGKRPRPTTRDGDEDDVEDDVLVGSGEQQSTSPKTRRLNSGARVAGGEPGEDDLLHDSPEQVSSVPSQRSATRRASIRNRTPLAANPSSANSSRSARSKPTSSPHDATLPTVDENGEEDELSFLEPVVSSVEKPQSSRRATRSSPLSVSEPVGHENTMDVEDELSFEDTTRPDRTSTTTRTTTIRSETFMPDLEGTRQGVAHDNDDETDGENGEQDSVPAPASNNRRPSHVIQKAVRKTKARPARKKPRQESDSGAGFAITVYRRSKKASSGTDHLAGIALPKFTPSDVLAQVVDELCTALIERKKAKSGATSRDLLPLMNYKNAINEVLFDISVAQDSVFALQARLRKAKREQSERRAELMHIKRERHELTLRMDSVRSEHLMNSREEEERRDLLNDIDDFRRSVRRHREKAQEKDEDEIDDGPEDLGHLLGEVRAAVNNGGLLHSVVDFNHVMTRALESLD